MRKLAIDQIGELFSAISKDRTLYLPIERKGKVDFYPWSEDAKVRLDALNTVRSAKDLFFPQSEDLVEFQVEGKNISVLPPAEPNDPFVLFGVRACDARSFDVLDKVFLNEPVDTYYQARRNNGIVITLACNEPEETCFCGVFGIDATNPSGDVAAWIANGNIYFKPLTDKGAAFADSAFCSMETAEEAELEETVRATKEILEKLPLQGLSLRGFGKGMTERLFHDPRWEELSRACIACGTCTYVCPTCQCYDIRDFDTGKGIQRYRCWDSCMYSDFTRMAHGNPRKTQLERFRQRFMHKLVYFPDNNDGMYSCVGCGRCVAKCPISMNIVKVIKTLGEDSNE
jgi:sulfhydrogenase subunit beta (sulfur reductase)